MALSGNHVLRRLETVSSMRPSDLVGMGPVWIEANQERIIKFDSLEQNNKFEAEPTKQRHRLGSPGNNRSLSQFIIPKELQLQVMEVIF